MPTSKMSLVSYLRAHREDMFELELELVIRTEIDAKVKNIWDTLEKEMATHSSTLAWRIPWREEPGGLQSMGSQRVGND